MNEIERKVYDRYAYSNKKHIFLVYIEFVVNSNNNICLFDYLSWKSKLMLTDSQMYNAIEVLKLDGFIEPIEAYGIPKKYYINTLVEVNKKENMNNINFVEHIKKITLKRLYDGKDISDETMIKIIESIGNKYINQHKLSNESLSMMLLSIELFGITYALNNP